MTQLVRSKTAPYCNFTKFEAGEFRAVLSGQDRKIVLREASLDSFRNMSDFAEMLLRAEDERLTNILVSIAHSAHALATTLCANTGPDRMFQNPKKTAMQRMGMPGANAIPSTDHELSLLSLNMVALANWLKIISLDDLMANLRPPSPIDMRSTYEKAFGAPPPSTP